MIIFIQIEKLCLLQQIVFITMVFKASLNLCKNILVVTGVCQIGWTTTPHRCWRDYSQALPYFLSGYLRFGVASWSVGFSHYRRLVWDGSCRHYNRLVQAGYILYSGKGIDCIDCKLDTNEKLAKLDYISTTPNEIKQPREKMKTNWTKSIPSRFYMAIDNVYLSGSSSKQCRSV